MTKHKVNVLDDNALRAFYHSCGVSPKITEGAIKARYEESTKGVRVPFHRKPVAVQTARALRERRPQKMRRAK
jgi:hypothetical protein